MIGKDWLVSNYGQCLPCDVVPQTEELSRPYRLYRFLTDLEDILDHIREYCLRLEAIRPLVRKLLISSD
jgi:hypothetical protein